MLVEIPDPDVLLEIVVAFVIGLFSIVIYNKIKPLVKAQSDQVRVYLERLQYYENQLIDMKIKMDSIEIEKDSTPLEVPIKKEKQPQLEPIELDVHEEAQKERVPNMNFVSATDFVLKLITERSMTSRDIQITIGRTREHTSRLLKKLFEEGFVERNMKTKPFTYNITDKGRLRLGLAKAIPN